MTTDPEELEGEGRAVRQAFELWIIPEIERRRSRGLEGEGFELCQAQIVFSRENDAPVVRLNDEVKATLTVRVNRPIAEGETLSPRDIDEILGASLTAEDPNAAHVTLIRHMDTWVMAFDFRYNAARIADVVETAQEFLACAAFAVEQGFRRAAVDNLFSGVELMAKAILLQLPDSDPPTTHTHIKDKYNWWGGLGNANRRYVELLNRLSDLRKAARYPPREFPRQSEELASLLATARQMLAEVVANTPRRSGRRSQPSS